MNKVRNSRKRGAGLASSLGVRDSGWVHLDEGAGKGLARGSRGQMAGKALVAPPRSLIFL